MVSALLINGKQATTTKKSVARPVAATQGASGSTAVGGTTATGTSAGSGLLTTKKSGVDKIELSLLSIVTTMILCGFILAL